MNPITPTPRPKLPERSYQKRAALAKKWGNANGYFGHIGGWVYRDGVAVCQGWTELYRIHKYRIEGLTAQGLTS